jgi:hypothetical protein
LSWPPRDGRPAAFPEAVNWAAEKIGVDLSGRDIPEELLDAGVDIIAWKPYPDNRNGFMILVAQDTIQFDFRTKPRDVQASRWRDWLEIGVQPSVGFAVPFVIPAGDIWWDQVAVDVNLVLDRGRLLHELDAEEPTSWPTWSEIVAFVDKEVTEYREGGGGAAVPPRRKKRST